VSKPSALLLAFYAAGLALLAAAILPLLHGCCP